MLEIVKTINGVKQLVPLTTDSGQGLPLGAWTSFEDDQPRNGYLKAGTTFNQSDYPALYNMLGTNVVPDKGYGLDWDNAEAITLSTSDYVVQKNGWLVGAYTPISGGTGFVLVNGIVVSRGGYQSGAWVNSASIQMEVKKGDVIKTLATLDSQDFHLIPYLHPMFIKAVIGPIEDSAADQVVQNINNSRSYSTEEVNTGKTWIDGKPIYRRVIEDTTSSTADASKAITIPNYVNIETITDVKYLLYYNGVSTKALIEGNYYENSTYNVHYWINPNDGTVVAETSSAYINKPLKVILEYTKTTDQATS